MGSHKSFYLNTMWQYFLQIIKYLLPLLVMPYLTRVLEPEGYAIYAYVVSFMTFVQTFVDFGFNLSGTKSVAAAGNSHELNLIVGRITQARLLLCVIAGFFCLVIGFFIPILHDNWIYVSFAFISVCGRALAPDFLFQGKERMGPITIRYLISKSVSTLLTFILVHSAVDLLWIPVLDILASAIALLWSFAAAKKMFGCSLTFDVPRSVIGELLRSGYYCMSNMASTAFSGVITLIIGIAITDSAQVAYWSLAMTAIGAVQSLYAPIINSLYPHMVAGHDYSFAKKLVLASLPFVLLGTLAFVALSRPIVLILGGPEYLNGAYVLPLLSPLLVFSFYGMISGWPILGAMGKVKELTRTTVVSSILSILMLLIVVMGGHPSIEIFAIIRCITEALMCSLRLFECGRAKKSSFRHEAD